MNPLSDAELLARAGQDGEAFRPLVERHLQPVYRYIARRLGPDHAEDIASEVFATAYRQRDRFDPAASDARPWLLGIATNLIRRHARSEARMLRAYARTGVDPAAPAADEEARTGGNGRALAAALHALPSDQREALLLHVISELSIDEIALALGAPPGTVKSWLHRARTTAAQVLERHGVLPTFAALDKELNQ